LAIVKPDRKVDRNSPKKEKAASIKVTLAACALDAVKLVYVTLTWVWSIPIEGMTALKSIAQRPVVPVPLSAQATPRVAPALASIGIR
jgi:hypothetical protein